MKTPFLILALVASVATALAVDPPPDGGYPNNNTAEGQDALFDLTTGDNNTALGFNALYNNTTGRWNTGVGSEALLSNTTGLFNVALGFEALTDNTVGVGNVAVGANAMQFNISGDGNTAVGGFALSQNSNGFDNVAIGGGALMINSSGSQNSAIGTGALGDNTTGGANVAIGDATLSNNTRGALNIAIGYNAGHILETGSNNIYIANVGDSANDSGRIRIGTVGTHGRTFIAGIYGVTVGSGIPVIVDSNGRLGTVTSSARYKDKIKPMAESSEAILSLNPVTFRYKKDLDPDAIPQFGLVAEDVAKVNPDLVAKDDEGKPYTVRYEAVNAMLLNEFLKEHCKVEEQASEIKDLKSALQQQEARWQDVTARLAAKGL